MTVVLPQFCLRIWLRNSIPTSVRFSLQRICPLSSIPSADYVYTGCESDKLLEIQIELGTVMKVLDKFRCDKAGGTDELSSRLLIELKEVICYHIMKIISESLLTGIVPDDWKTANVTSIFKKGNRQRVENYRPVSLTSLIGKACETVIRDAILDHLDRTFRLWTHSMALERVVRA